MLHLGCCTNVCMCESKLLLSEGSEQAADINSYTGIEQGKQLQQMRMSGGQGSKLCKEAALVFQ